MTGVNGENKLQRSVQATPFQSFSGGFPNVKDSQSGAEQHGFVGFSPAAREHDYEGANLDRVVSEDFFQSLHPDFLFQPCCLFCEFQSRRQRDSFSALRTDCLYALATHKNELIPLETVHLLELHCDGYDFDAACGTWSTAAESGLFKAYQQAVGAPNVRSCGLPGSGAGDSGAVETVRW